MGNRWSAIATRLPGRTDNEIKNVWHTHLKKRVKVKPNPNEEETKEGGFGLSRLETSSSSQMSWNQIDSPQPSCTDISSVTTSTKYNLCMEDMVLENFPEMDDEFWSEVFSGGDSGELGEVCEGIGQPPSGSGYESNLHDDMDFWFNVFTRGEELPRI
ncbi:hypothetical protein L1987_13257 [Smallanthus sonchifolius]|uniref:Uncharacterized protein n=1 Tax=Smallanthus sonchifolius TaxID=185202 RepID=A0ACB9JID5_9ASTR|nr:hypothetical protein L1987_13257 [Smallanthus sonchifolius]